MRYIYEIAYSDNEYGMPLAGYEWFAANIEDEIDIYPTALKIVEEEKKTHIYAAFYGVFSEEGFIAHAIDQWLDFHKVFDEGDSTSQAIDKWIKEDRIKEFKI